MSEYVWIVKSYGGDQAGDTWENIEGVYSSERAANRAAKERKEETKHLQTYNKYEVFRWEVQD